MSKAVLIVIIPLLFILSVASIVVLAFTDLVKDYLPELALVLLLLFAFAALSIISLTVLSQREQQG
jgi:hypothetical protein